ncbi:MAG: acyltransferase [Aeromicrobium sp.]
MRLPAVLRASALLKLLPWLRTLNRLHQGRYMAAVEAVLRRSGVEVVGHPLWIAPSVYLDLAEPGSISIGDRVAISESVSLLTHDFSLDRVAESRRELPADEELLRVAPVRIEARVFIGMSVMVLPGVTIGEGAIVGAGAVVTHDVAPDTVVAGNPARFICTTADLWSRRHTEFETRKRRP